MKMKRALLLMVSAVSALLFMASPARAGMYSFDFLVGNYGVNAIVTVAEAANGISNGTAFGHDILSIAGVVSGAGGGPIVSLVDNPNHPNATSDFGFQYDNVAFPTQPYLNLNGVLFKTAAGDIWNLWGIGADNYRLYSYTANGGVDTIGTLSVASVPEAQTYAMLIAGLAIVAVISRRRLTI